MRNKERDGGECSFTPWSLSFRCCDGPISCNSPFPVFSWGGLGTSPKQTGYLSSWGYSLLMLRSVCPGLGSTRKYGRLVSHRQLTSFTTEVSCGLQNGSQGRGPPFLGLVSLKWSLLDASQWESGEQVWWLAEMRNACSWLNHSEFITARRAGGFDHYNILHVFFFFLAHTFVSFISTMSHGLKLWITRNFHVEIEHVDEEPKNDFSEFTRRFFKNKKRLWKV